MPSQFQKTFCSQIEGLVLPTRIVHKSHSPSKIQSTIMSLLYVSRCLTTSQLKTLQKRFLSGQGSAALNKFRGVFEEYRLQK
mmetsp:Transcript_17243/g.32708  ORF Transcript_17243/g.32708 Transcript_17243/m.32708 type:complete len:82 (-) Transcript_17243:401-646(-)